MVKPIQPARTANLGNLPGFGAVFGVESERPQRAPLGWVLQTALNFSLLLPLAYPFMAFRHLYGEGPVRTSIKVLVLGFVHLSTLMLALMWWAPSRFTPPRSEIRRRRLGAA